MAGVKPKIARIVGKSDWADDGRCSVPFSVMLVNFSFQRILGLNRSCRFPVHFTSVVVEPRNLRAGLGFARYLASSPGVYIQALNGVYIGDRVMMAPGVKILSANHVPGATESWSSDPPIEIGDDVWLGANCVVLPGVKLGNGCVIGAGAVVTKSMPADATVVGVAAAPLATSSGRAAK